MKSTAVVILNYNGANHLSTYLPSVVEYSEEADIIVIDNASTDHSLEVLKSFPQVTLISLTSNLGFAGGYNVGLLQLSHPNLILLNSDVRVTKGWLSPLVHALSQDEIAACQPKILSDLEPTQFEYAGASGGLIDQLGYPLCRGRIFDHLETDENQYQESSDCFWASGACLAIKKTAFYSINGFDQRFFAHMEEIDLCWRLQLSGFRIHVAPASTVYHLGGGTLNKVNPKKTFLNFRNNLLMLSKNLGGMEKFRIIFMRLILDGVAGIKFLLELKPMHCWAVIQAHFSFYHLSIFEKRPEWTPEQPKSINKLSGVINKSVVFSFYAKGIKTFNELVLQK